MEKLILLFLLVILPFVVYQDASALTISAIPVKQEFGANEWIKVNVTIQGYNGGPVNWIAHKPDNSTISGVLDQQQIRSGRTIHQIIRSASDNEFGLWSINYGYGGSNQTARVNVRPLDLIITTDKSTYYEPDTMNINITSSSYTPYAKFAHSYFLDFYDQDGNKVIGIEEIEIKANEPTVTYNLPMLQFAKYNPPGLYKLKIQYFNSVKYIPFLLGDINKLMEISVYSQTSTYYPGDDVILDLHVTSVKESTGVVTITDPSGNTISKEFPVNAVHSEISLQDITNKTGVYQFNIKYVGVSSSGSFNVVTNPKPLPNIKVSVFLDKLNYRPGETMHVKVYTSQVITNSTSFWVIDPNGIEYPKLSLPATTVDTILQHKISKNDTIGQWELYIDYDGIIRSASYFVKGQPVNNTETFNTDQFNIPVFISNFATNFTSPTGIAIDSNGDVYVVDSGNSKINKFDSNGKLLLSWGNSGNGNGQFVHPNGIVVGSNYVYVADTGNARIQMFYKNGTFVYSWGKYGDEHSMFHTPIALAFDERGDLFVADSGRNRIQIFDSQFVYLNEIRSSITGDANFSAINGIAFDTDDNFYVSTVENKILKFSSTYELVNFYGSAGTEEGRFNNPTAIAIDSKGDFYIADTNNHRIQKFDQYGNFLLSWGSEGDSVGQFEEPVGLGIDPSDNIYVVDKSTKNIQKFALYGTTNNLYLPSSPPANNTVSIPTPPANNTVSIPTPPVNNTVSIPTPPVNNTVSIPTPPVNNTVSIPTSSNSQPPHAEDFNVDSKEKNMVLDIIKQWEQANLHK